MDNKFFRFVALLLVPCLVADSVMASAVNCFQPSSSVCPLNQPRFVESALAEASEFADHLLTPEFEGRHLINGVCATKDGEIDSLIGRLGNYGYQLEAIKKLGKMGREATRAIPALIVLYRFMTLDSELNSTLRSIGPATAAELPALELLLSHAEPEVRKKAAQSVAQAKNSLPANARDMTSQTATLGNSNIFQRATSPDQSPSASPDPSLAQQFDRLANSYQDQLQQVYDRLGEYLQMPVSVLRESIRALLIEDLKSAEALALAVVELIERHGRTKFDVNEDLERYYRNASGGSLDSEHKALIDADARWLLESFDLADHPEYLNSIPVHLMGLSSITTWLISIAETMFETGYSQFRHLAPLLQIFDQHSMIFSQSLAVHMTQTISGHNHRVNLLLSGLPASITVSLNTHEYAHQLLNAVDPSYKTSNLVQGTGPSDWYTTALELLSLQRHGGLEIALKGEMGSDPINERLFSEYLQLPEPVTTKGRIGQMESLIQKYLPDDDRIKQEFYRRGAVLGAEALRGARLKAASEGRQGDESYIYLLAGRYVAAAARGGPSQTFETAVENAERALAQEKRQPGVATIQPPINSQNTVYSPAAIVLIPFGSPLWISLFILGALLYWAITLKSWRHWIVEKGHILESKIASAWESRGVLMARRFARGLAIAMIPINFLLLASATFASNWSDVSPLATTIFNYGIIIPSGIMHTSFDAYFAYLVWRVCEAAKPRAHLRSMRIFLQILATAATVMALSRIPSDISFMVRIIRVMSDPRKVFSANALSNDLLYFLKNIVQAFIFWNLKLFAVWLINFKEPPLGDPPSGRGSGPQPPNSWFQKSA
jgi:hypothetical protein